MERFCYFRFIVITIFLITVSTVSTIIVIITLPFSGGKLSTLSLDSAAGNTALHYLTWYPNDAGLVQVRAPVSHYLRARAERLPGSIQ